MRFCLKVTSRILVLFFSPVGLIYCNSQGVAASAGLGLLKHGGEIQVEDLRQICTSEILDAAIWLQASYRECLHCSAFENLHPKLGLWHTLI